MEVDCPDGLCLDDEVFTVTVNGLNNRYSTYRGTAPFEEVFVETFDPTNNYQVDYSSHSSFVDELIPGSVTLNQSFVNLSRRTVGQRTDFSFIIDYSGMKTHRGDSV